MDELGRAPARRAGRGGPRGNGRRTPRRSSGSAPRGPVPPDHARHGSASRPPPDAIIPARAAGPDLSCAKTASGLACDYPCSCDRPNTRETGGRLFRGRAVGILRPSAPPTERCGTPSGRKAAGRRVPGGSAFVATCRRAMVDYAARRTYRWCRPPTSGICTTAPTSGRAMGLTSGASLLSAR